MDYSRTTRPFTPPHPARHPLRLSMYTSDRRELSPAGFQTLLTGRFPVRMGVHAHKDAPESHARKAALESSAPAVIQYVPRRACARELATLRDAQDARHFAVDKLLDFVRRLQQSGMDAVWRVERTGRDVQVIVTLR